jgi:hypothetical protein
MSQGELAAYIQQHLQERGITVVLSGGAAVTIYTVGEYVSKDIDLVNVNSVDRKRIKTAMEEIGFRETARYFHHAQSEHIVEFPPGPLAIDDQPVKELKKVKLATGTLRVISPTDCVKDRLAAYYFWDDRPGLEQALMVAAHRDVDMPAIRRWSAKVGMLPKYEIFRRRRATKKPRG